FLASFAVFFVMILRPYICTLFPYTTLFRSYFCILYSSIIANEVVNDRTTRINELLFAMSSARIQLIGKIVGLYVLLIIQLAMLTDRKSTRLNSSHVSISYAVFCLKKKKQIL